MPAFHLQKPKGVTLCPPLLLYNLSACGTHRTCVGCSARLSRAGHVHCIAPARWWHIQKSHRNSWRCCLVRLCFPGDRELIPATQYGHFQSWRSYGIWKRQLEDFPRNIYFSFSLLLLFTSPELKIPYCWDQLPVTSKAKTQLPFLLLRPHSYFGIGGKVSDADFDLRCLKQGEVWAIQQHLC